MSIDLFNENSEYVQSANTLFHFMNQLKYLLDALDKKALVPRYCDEDISYLGINIEGKSKNNISVLQKCFCDLPFHNLANSFHIHIAEDDLEKLTENEKEEARKYNTHPAFYGKYAIAFSKPWGEQHNLQPIHYLNRLSKFSVDIHDFLEYAFSLEDLPDEIYENILSKLSFIKPLRGMMTRTLSTGTTVHFTKNFHDEKEWRYVPDSNELHKRAIERVIVNRDVANKKNKINESLEDKEYQSLWLKFNYEDVKYLIVSNSWDRLDLINYINNLPDEKFSTSSINEQKDLLKSRILVLDEIRGDW